MTKHRILIVDDEPKVAFFFQKHLEMVDEGYIAKAVNSGADALEELKKEPYDLMLTDLRMPQMDGLELVRQVRKISPKTKTILITAYGTNNVWNEAGQLEVFRALSKPLKIPQLLESVREALAPPTHSQSNVTVLSGENFEQLANRIEALRVDIGARATVLADTTGHILVSTGSIAELELSSTMALLGGTVAASNALAEQLNYARPMHLSYYEGPPYDLYAVNLSHHYFLTSIFDRRKEASRIGLVWLYTRRALEEMLDLLHNKTTASPLGREFAESVQSELDDLLAGPGQQDVARPKSSQETVALSTQTKEVSPSTLADNIAGILARFNQQTKIAIEYRLDALEAPLPPQASALIQKTVGECLKNVYQHAKATIVGVSFNRDGRFLQGSIADNGIGFTPNQPPTMKTLAAYQKAYEAAGGSLEVVGYQDQGAKINFRLPISE
ncbi:MAG: response regulator [Ardenticatenaceae bacterium]|nr:response regulator [Anaerolineales bacterium]MCB8923307.1 response regulator [Ardenticatenaceae bacterium]MCB8992047.1 response regulator [Ardenticatenaceae bacterium]MCB9004694.1 response regulator [Ardenticatenaceae bacterium]